MMMEAIQNIEARALKPSLRREILMKATQQVFSDDVFCLNSGSVAAGEEFSVDDLLDLSNENFEDEEEEEKDSISVSSQDRVGDDNPNYSAGNVEAFPAVPVDDWKDLEWVSQFVDDSVSEISMLYPAGYKTGTAEEKRSDGAAEPQSPACLRRLLEKTPVKARSKRPRIAKPRWCRPFDSPSLTDSSSTSSFSSSASTPALALVPASLHAMEQLVCSLGQQFQFQKPPRKRQKKSRAGSGSGSGAATVPQTQRRCSHCQVQKTPQWRTGPLGAKTLCNACGVRYKSGRLFPEYRPACSPTFSVKVHSNSHRKVLEMRRKKETCGPDSGLSQMVPSC